MFDASTIPVLEQVVNFAQARHGVLAGNIANLDTPGYRARDLPPAEFQKQLKTAIETHQHAMASPGFSSEAAHKAIASVSESMESLLYHDQSDVNLENQVAEIAKNQSTHNLALSIMRQQFRLLESAIRERIV